VDKRRLIALCVFAAMIIALIGGAIAVGGGAFNLNFNWKTSSSGPCPPCVCPQREFTPIPSEPQACPDYSDYICVPKSKKGADQEETLFR
jgi:hypothetical protein